MRRHWFDRLERSFGHWAFHQLSTFIVAMNALVWILSLIRPEFPATLTLEPYLVLQGQVWRLFTFLFLPPTMSPIWMFFWLYLLYIYAQALESHWGDFRFNLFYGLGALSTIAASLFLGVGLSNVPLNTTIFLAFAALYPDFELLLFFILPVKVKWLAWLAWILIGLNFLAGSWITRAALAAGLLNYALFFGAEHLDQLRAAIATWRHRRRYKDKFK